MIIKFEGSVTLEKTEGKFESKDAAIAALEEELDASIGAFTFEGDNGGTYEATDYDINLS